MRAWVGAESRMGITPQDEGGDGGESKPQDAMMYLIMLILY